MEKKSQDFSLEDALRLAKSPAAQELIALLQRRDSTGLQQAMEDAAAGNYKNAGQRLNGLLASPEAQALLRELGR